MNIEEIFDINKGENGFEFRYKGSDKILCIVPGNLVDVIFVGKALILAVLTKEIQKLNF